MWTESTHYLGLDIGGSTLNYGIINKDTHQIEEMNSTPTNQGKEALLSQCKSIIQTFEQVKIPIYIGMPGRFMTYGGVMQAGSAKQLETYPEEWTGVNVQAEFEQAFGQGVTIINDAVAQCRGGIYDCMKTMGESALIGKKIGFLGIGTGLGGGFMRYQGKGQWETVTDGHVCDILIHNEQGEKVCAESLISGQAIKKQTGSTLESLLKGPGGITDVQPILDTMEIHLMQLIRQLKWGDIEHQDAQYSWSDDEKAWVSEIDVLLLGGSIGEKGLIGDRLLTGITYGLKDDGLCDNLNILTLEDSKRAGLVGLA